jgi:putative addiction module component (TIGR02574 family)
MVWRVRMPFSAYNEQIVGHLKFANIEVGWVGGDNPTDLVINWWVAEQQTTHLRCSILHKGDVMNTKELIAEAISLPVEERALMVDCLLKSLTLPETDIDKRWASVAQRRLDDLRAGRAETVPGENVFEKIWQRLDK